MTISQSKLKEINRYISNKSAYVDTKSLAQEIEESRNARNYLTWRILNRTYNDHLRKPNKVPKSIWDPLQKSFTVTDLARPVLTTINSATYGGRVTRRIRKAFNKEKLEKFLKESNYDSFIPEFHRYAVAYGTSFAHIGERNGKGCLTSLPPIQTFIDTKDSNLRDPEQVTTFFRDFIKVFRSDGTYELVHRDTYFEQEIPTEKDTLILNSNYGFIPVTIGRGSWMDACTPYGESLIWPAVEETKQVTYLMCHLMILEKSQSFSTLVVQGDPISNPAEQGFGPWYTIRFRSEDENAKAYYISPDADIDKINKIIESKFERTATQCQVPVELFTRSKSGTNQAAGAAALNHKPLYDLVVEQQRMWSEVEMDLLARIDAFISFKETGKRQDLKIFKENLDVSIEFEHEVNPSISMADAQTWEMLVDSGFVDHEKAIEHFNKKDATPELIKKLKSKRKKREITETDSFGEFPRVDTGDN